VGEPIGCCGCGRRRLPLRSAERAPLGRQDLDLTCGEEMDTSFSSELSQEVSSNDGMTDMSSCNLVRESSSGACMRFPNCSLHSVGASAVFVCSCHTETVQVENLHLTDTAGLKPVENLGHGVPWSPSAFLMQSPVPHASRCVPTVRFQRCMPR
jgi:hypothetical protein